MKTLKNKYLNCSLLALMLLVAGCSERDLNDLQQATLTLTLATGVKCPVARF